ncbi:Lsr2 family DNA-binding protein [Streptomyces abikoensis]|uniref:Histone-like nucleoid-structuring protein Lsr2 n=1 Tax=Streptomyces abikoensis TaxID=97398 RepID=A0ABW7T5V8_9ACTN
MRKTVLVPVEKRLCDAHIARDGSEVEASSTLALGRHTWDLCMEHDVVFGRYLCDALGVPVVEDVSDGGQTKGVDSVHTPIEPDGCATFTTTQSPQVKGVATVCTPESGGSRVKEVNRIHTPSPEGVHPVDIPEPEVATATAVQASRGPEAEAGTTLDLNEGSQVSEPVEPTFHTMKNSQVKGVSSAYTPESVGEPAPSVMLAGEVPGYSWDEARQALRNCGYEVVGRADGSTVLLILGEGGERNATKLRDAREANVPCMDVRAPGRFKTAVRTGVFVGGDPLPEPVKADRSGMSERERNRAVRAWARANGFTVPEKGRIPMNVRHAWKLAHQAETVAA